MQTAWFLFDLLLLLGATARITRLITTDDLGLWWVRYPAMRWAVRADHAVDERRGISQHRMATMTETKEWEPGWRGKLVTGLSCPFCVGFWVGVVLVATLALAGGPGEASPLWRYLMAPFTLNYITAHTAVRLGDTGSDDE